MHLICDIFLKKTCSINNVSFSQWLMAVVRVERDDWLK